MSVEIVMTRGSYECLAELIPDYLSEQIDAPTYLHGSTAMPDQVAITCSLAIAEALFKLARPSCRAAAEDIRIAIAEYRRAKGEE